MDPETEKQTTVPVPEMETETPAADAQTLTLEAALAELETTRQALKKANAEAAARRKKLDAYEQKEKEAADAELAETERLQRQLADANTQRDRALQQLKDATISAAVQAEAARLGFINPADALGLGILGAIELSEEGQIKGAKEAVERLAKDRPYLLRPPAGAGVGTPARTAAAKPATSGAAPTKPLVRF